jgi:TM2 domain-containing membrane protein YozV
MENIDQNLTNFNTPQQPPPENKKMAAGLCALLIGGMGIHKFVLGYKTEGLILAITYGAMLLLTFITCGIGAIITAPILGVMHVITLIEGIIYLTKSDEEFYETYQKNKKAWF